MMTTTPAATPQNQASPHNQEGLREQMLALLPSLRGFARGLAGQRAEADDLVQETLLKALSNVEQFRPGTNLRAWLFTILRNHFYSTKRQERHEVSDSDGSISAMQSVPPPQEGALVAKELAAAMRRLPEPQREALLLVAVFGLSYEEAASIGGCAIGTMKSRVNRARNRLGELLGLEAGQRATGSDAVMLAGTRL
ncbi:sigma-70 family RNA polymerase sigma factor [Ferrovibrio sp.]|uniref:sigma-70 family RNA polymerase sigma factor n=1 Tax=Ferrovibrio sp. TaxID=1917215 RepID=UPI003D28AF4B